MKKIYLISLILYAVISLIDLTKSVDSLMVICSPSIKFPEVCDKVTEVPDTETTYPKAPLLIPLITDDDGHSPEFRG